MKRLTTLRRYVGASVCFGSRQALILVYQDADFLRTGPWSQPRCAKMERANRPSGKPSGPGTWRPTGVIRSIRRSIWCTCLLRRPYYISQHGFTAASGPYSSSETSLRRQRARSHNCFCCHAQNEGKSLITGIFYLRLLTTFHFREHSSSFSKVKTGTYSR